MTLQQKLINEYNKTIQLKKEITSLEKQYKQDLLYQQDLKKEIQLKEQEIKKERYRKFKEYNLFLQEQKGISVKYENTSQNKLLNLKLQEQLDSLKLNLVNITYKANSSYEEWNFLKKMMKTPSMEEIYAKNS